MGIVDQILDLVFTPGSSLKLVPAINVTLVSLLCLMLYMGDGYIPPFHLNVMAGLSICLLLSVNWFMMELRKEMKRQEEDGREVEEKAREVEEKAKSD